MGLRTGAGAHGNRMFYRPNTLFANRTSIIPKNHGERLVDFLRFAYANGAVGTDYDSCQNHWALEGLVYYLLARAHWNPEAFDLERETRDYCEAGFGPAADVVQEYFHELAEVSQISSEQDVDPRMLFNEARVERLESLLNRAAELAQTALDPLASERVDFLRLGLEAGILRAQIHQLSHSQGVSHLQQEASARYRELLLRIAEEQPMAVNVATAAFRSRDTLRRASQ